MTLFLVSLGRLLSGSRCCFPCFLGGTLANNGTITNEGTINNNASGGSASGTLINNGTITNNNGTFNGNKVI